VTIALKPARDDGVVLPAPEVARRYRDAGWWTDEPLHERVLRHAASTPGSVAFSAGGRHLTYRQLAEAVERAARGLALLGIRRHDRVVVQLPNVAELVTTVLGLVRLGAPAVLTLPALGERELRHIVQATRAAAIVVDARERRGASLAAARGLLASSATLRHLLTLGGGAGAAGEVGLDTLLEAPSEAGALPSAGHAPDDVAVYLLSSGTTGLPKPIPRTHQDYMHNLEVSAACAGLNERSVYLAAAPVTHNFAFGCPGVMGTLASGGRAVLARTLDAGTALGLVAAERVTHTATVPSVALQWVEAAREARFDLSSLRVLQVGGARLQPEHARRAMAVLGCQVQQVYGMAEGLLNFTRLDDPPEVVTGTQGRPASPGDEWRIVDELGHDVPPGASGELLVRGPYTIGGYLADEQVNAAAFTADGYYRTGDVVRLHPSGNFVVEGRRKDFINRGGEKISAEELEALLACHGKLLCAVAVSMPSRAFGEAICIYAVPRQGERPSLRELRGFLSRQGVARFKLPDRLEVVDQLPTNAVGKVDRAGLRRDIASKLARERD
jgi:2,3-dihydroxybenzoate-AMP ligase